MTKITSIDALIDRMKAAYPHLDERRPSLRGHLEAGKFALVYDWINNFSPRFSEITANRILSILDENGIPDEAKLSKLIAEAQEEIDEAALMPLRRQLAVDFRESFDFEEILWE